MLHTFLTDGLGLRYPIIGAPMAGVAGGRLARAVSHAGGLGMIGIGSETKVSFIEREAEIARGQDDTRFGLGLMIWAVERRPELLDACLAARPALLSLSFGTIAPYFERVHAAGILVATQVQTRQAALEAEAAGVDLIVAQGTEAGGHSHRAGVGTLTLLQTVLGAVEAPVLAAGGIASAAGLAAILAAGAQGAWIGTAFLASGEADNTNEARQRLIAAGETDTVLTDVFDRVQRTAWPAEHPGRALRNRFEAEWHGRADQLPEEVKDQYQQSRAQRDYDVAVIYAGQAAGMVTAERPAGEIAREIGEGAEALLRKRCEALGL